jgi:diguanylate cyclase (GGDEF)-like protein
MLFIASGVLGLVSGALPNAQATGTAAVYCASLAWGLVAAILPWHRWSHRSTLVFVPMAFALIVTGQWLNPHGATTLYGLWFAVVFGWVGSWHQRRTSLTLAPLAAVAFSLPFLPHAPAASPEALGTVVVAIPIALVLAEVLAARTAAMRRAQRGLESAAVLLQRASLIDDLTGVGNRRQANALLDTLEPGDGLILLDLDNFKTINDTLGHAEGDRVLMQLGSYLGDSVRDRDTVARFGGEEFVVVVRQPGTSLRSTAERLLDGWRRSGATVTLSAGAVLHVGDRGPTATFKRADDLLYKAKADGRDRLVCEGEPNPVIDLPSS